MYNAFGCKEIMHGKLNAIISANDFNFGRKLISVSVIKLVTLALTSDLLCIGKIQVYLVKSSTIVRKNL